MADSKIAKKKDPANRGAPTLLTDKKVASIKPPKAGQDEHRDLKVTGLRLRVGITGRKAWIIRARAGEKIINKTLGVYPAMGVGAARKAAENLLKTISKGGGVAALDRTFGDVAQLWLATLRENRRSPRYIAEVARKLELHAPELRDRRIIEIKRSEIRDLLEGLPGAVVGNRLLAAIRPIFKLALKRDWIEMNPADGIEKTKREIRRDRWLDMPEVKRVWDAAGRLGYPNGEFVRALLLTGQRRSEVAGMRWSDVDLDAAVWHLTAADTKAGRAHLVPLSPPMVELLKSLPRSGAFVFSSDGKSHVSGYAKQKARMDVLIAADGGDPVEGWRLHDLRRSAATHMVRLGVSIEAVGRVLNHAPVGVTAEVYVHHRFEPEKRVALDKWAAEVMRVVAGEADQKVVPIRG